MEVVPTCTVLPMVAQNEKFKTKKFIDSKRCITLVTPVVSEVLFPSDENCNEEDGETTGLSVVTSPTPIKNGRRKYKSTKRRNRSKEEVSFRVKSTGVTTKAKVNKELHKRKLKSDDFIIVRPRKFEDYPWVRKPTRPVNLEKYSKVVANRREQGISIDIDISNIPYRIFQYPFVSDDKCDLEFIGDQAKISEHYKISIVAQDLYLSEDEDNSYRISKKRIARCHNP